MAPTNHSQNFLNRTTQAAPVNLKERIAALQQRNVSPSSTPRPASPSSAPAPNSAGLRDKIAKFEKKGGVPVPRGSFGLGAPPPGENAQQKRRGELYGNRIPSAARVASGGTPISRPMSPVESSRSFSMSATAPPVGDDGDDTLRPSSSTSSPPSPVSPFLGLSVDHAHGKDPTPRGTPFSAALDLAKQVASGAKADGKSDSMESPLVASKLSASDVKPEEEVPIGQLPQPSIEIVVSPAEEVVSPVEVLQDPVFEDPAPVHQNSTSPISDPSKSVETRDQPQRTDDTKVQVTTPETPIQPPRTPSPGSNPVIVLNATKEDPNTTEPNAASVDPGSTTATIPTTVASQPEDAGKPATGSDGDGSTTVKSTNLVVKVDSPEASPIGPSTLANAAHDLGKLVANIQDMFPGQISPIVTPPGAKPHRALESAAKPPTSTVTQTPKEAKPKVPQNQKPTVLIDKKDEQEIVKTQTQRPVVDEPAKAAVSRTLSPLQPSPSSPRPTSMIETSSQRTNPPSARHPPGQLDYEHFPPTPVETSFGTVTAHKPSHSFSSTDRKPTFTAVVHKKTTEIPRPQPTAFQLMPTTPQTSKTGAPMLGEVLLSPGFGELTSLLQDAAMLEQSLETGQLPGEEAKRKEAEKLNWAEEETRIAPAKPVEEEKTRKVNTKRDSADGKSKSRNPMLRSKTWRKDDSGEVQANPPRSKSVLLPFRPATAQDTSSTSRQSLPSQRAAQEPSKADVDDSSLRSPPKSPRQYFASLRRFASSSRSSLTSGAQHSRYSVSTSSEMSSEDSASLPTPPGAIGLESLDSGQTEMGWKGDVSWPAVSPKKPPSIMSAKSRAASFADKMWGRSRTRSTMSSRSEYDSIGEFFYHLPCPVLFSYSCWLRPFGQWVRHAIGRYVAPSTRIAFVRDRPSGLALTA